MTTVNERRFHLLMGGLVLVSLLLDRLLSDATPAWHPPRVTLVTLVLGMVWVGLFAGYRGRNLEDRIRVLEDRLDRAQHKIDALEDEARERRRLPGR